MTPDEDDLETFLAAQAAKAPLDQETDTETPPGIVGPKAGVPASPVKTGPDLTPYGMAAPPEVSRDRLGEIASTILGAIAGKDKNARRAALAGGIANMISAKPGEEVAKENYDRKLLAARLSSTEAAQKARANAPVDPYKKLYAETTVQRIQWEKDARDPNSEASKNARKLLIDSGVNPQAVEGQSAYALGQFKGIAAATGETGKQKEIIDYREGKKINEETRDFETWRKKHGIDVATDKDLALFRAEVARNEKTGDKERERSMREPYPGLEVISPRAYSGVQADETAYRQLGVATDAYSALIEAMRNMIEIRKQYGAEIPGHAQALFDSYKTNAVGAYTKLGESGTLNGGEWERYSTMIPGLEPDKLDVAGLAMGKDLKLEQLNGVLEASRRVIDSRLRSKGVRFNPEAGIEQHPAPAPRKVAPRARAVAPVVKSAADLDDL